MDFDPTQRAAEFPPAFKTEKLERKSGEGGIIERTRTITEKPTQGADVTTSQTIDKYRDVGNGILRIVEEVQAPGTAGQISTEYTYTDSTGTGIIGSEKTTPPDAKGPPNHLIGGRLHTLKRSDGYWETYEYHYNGSTKTMVTEIWSSWKDLSLEAKAGARHTTIILDSHNRSVVEIIGNQLVSSVQETITVGGDGTRTLIEKVKTGSNSQPLVTETAYYSDAIPRTGAGQNKV